MKVESEESNDPLLLTSDTNGVRCLTLNRPHKLNAFNQALFKATADGFEGAAESDEVKVLVLTAAGRAFSSGADMTDMARARSRDGSTSSPTDNPFLRLQQAAESFPKPLVAAVNGVGVGLGFTILGYCAFVFLAQSARFRAPFTELGLAPEASSSFLFPLRMGWLTAARALIAGEWLDSQQLMDCGFAMKVCADHEVVSTAMSYAADLAKGGVESLRATKMLMLDPYRDLVARTRSDETKTRARLRETQVHLDAVAAFFAR